ncbi:MAG: hypothetical protein C4549_07150 [Deltaproteobacteria bacterium]|jgi:hypothetical protein|nr:MAG: hypothetical protein C4549_07150 [Deltaproteobacteria bacterium]
MYAQRKLICQFVIACIVAVAISFPAVAQRTNDSVRDRQLIESPWRGKWLSDKGYSYSANVSLRVDQDFSVIGQIAWVLERSPRAEDQTKLGFGAIEYVRGKFFPEARVLRLEGYQKNDPHKVIGLDRYHLVISDNESVLGGITWNHGDWGGLITLICVNNP